MQVDILYMRLYNPNHKTRDYTMLADYEVTDTFGGEANYSWVRRETHEYVDEQHTSKMTMVRQLKRMMGVTGMRCRTEDFGDIIRVTPTGKNAPCIVGFITFRF